MNFQYNNSKFRSIMLTYILHYGFNEINFHHTLFPKVRLSKGFHRLESRLSQSPFPVFPDFGYIKWSVGKRTFIACSAPFLTGQFSGRRCGGCVSSRIFNQGQRYLVTSFLGKLDPSEDSPGFEVEN